MSSPNQAIVLTPAGAAAIAVVRLAGPAVAAFLSKHFSKPCAPGRCVHAQLSSGEQIIDDPVVVLDPAGQFADVNLHGGAWVVQSMLDLARSSGFDVIDAARAMHAPSAFDADTEFDREVVSHIPLARTDLSLRTLLAQSSAWDAIIDRLSRQQIQTILADRAMHWLLCPPRVAIVGVPNAGKSTLANRLFAQDRVITADTPGTTRDWVGELADIDGLAVMLMDTPGIRHTDDPIEAAAIHLSAAELEQVDAIVLVLDASAPLPGPQEDLLRRYPHAIRVINKIDRAGPWNPAAVAGGLPTAASTGQGVGPLRNEICRHFGCDASALPRPLYWTQRQRDLLDRSLQLGQPPARDAFFSPRSSGQCPGT